MSKCTYCNSDAEYLYPASRQFFCSTHIPSLLKRKNTLINLALEATANFEKKKVEVETSYKAAAGPKKRTKPVKQKEAEVDSEYVKVEQDETDNASD